MTDSNSQPEFADITPSPDIRPETAPQTHNSRVFSSQWYERNRDRILPKQREYKAEKRKETPYIVKFDNDRAKAKRGGYFPSSFSKADRAAVLDLYKRAHAEGATIALQTLPQDGGMWVASNLKLVPAFR